MADKEVMKAITDETAERPRLLVEALTSKGLPPFTEPAECLASALAALAVSWRSEADLWAASRSKGWQSTATRLREAAGLVSEVAEGLDKLAVSVPKTPPREPVEIVPSGAFVYRPEDNDKLTVDPGLTETMAYLRGDTDVIPGAPKTMLTIDDPTTGQVEIIAPAAADIHEEARGMTQTFPIPPAAMGQITGEDPFSDPKPPSWGGAGNGRYTPQGGRSLSFLDLMTPPPAHLVPKHWSWSQLESSEDCGVQYRMQRIEQLPQVPQWANIGGDAFHRATEDIDRKQQQTGLSYPTTPVILADIWEDYFSQAVAAVASTSPVPIDRWRVSAQGKENQDWWRVEGERMLSVWCENRAKIATDAGKTSPRKLAYLPVAAMVPGRVEPAVEWPFSITVDGPMGQLSYTGIVDRVWECADGTLLVEDLKTGSRMPKDTAQLGSYAWAVAFSGYPMAVAHGPQFQGVQRIMGTFYDARKGVWTPAVDLLAAHPWEEFVYRLHSAEAKRRAGLYTPHVSDFCVSCSVQYACPLRNRSTGSDGQAAKS